MDASLLRIMASLSTTLCVLLVYMMAALVKAVPTPIGILIWTIIVVLLEFGLVVSSVYEAWRDRKTGIHIWTRLWKNVLASCGRVRQLWKADQLSQAAPLDQEVGEAEGKPLHNTKGMSASSNMFAKYCQ